MPIFEYQCNSCSSQFQKLVRSSLTEINCPGCECGDVTKLMSKFATRIAGKVSTGSSCSSCVKNSCSGCSSAN